MDKPELRVAVIGDSAMWGQGLAEKDKYAFKSTQQIAALLGRVVHEPVLNSARSGACIRAGRTEADQRKAREEFVDTYPEFFANQDAINDFVIRNIQEVPLVRLYAELPNTFPTISYQVQRVSAAIGSTIDVLFIDGGINDLDFQTFLNVQKHESDFVEFFDPQLQEYFSMRLRSLLSQAREKFPNAVIIVPGYWTPFAEGVSKAEVNAFIKHESGQSGYLIWFNDNVISVENVNALVFRLQVRAQYGLGRALYWMRKVIAEANEDPKFRGPGILFAHPQFGPDNTAFAPNSFLHREFEVSKVKDAAKKIRFEQCPRLNQAFRYQGLLTFFGGLLVSVVLHKLDQLTPDEKKQITDDVQKNAKDALATLTGPTSLLEAFRAVIDDPLNEDVLRSIVIKCESELGRIHNAERASFLHPNEKGAERYTGVIVKRFDERLHHIRLRNDLAQLTKRTSGQLPKTLSLKNNLRRYGLGSQTSLQAITQFVLVDSIRLEIVTAEDSDRGMDDDIFLNLGAGNRWRLNFPRFNAIAERLHTNFKPGSVDSFTIDARAVHLGSITQFTLERVADPKLPTGISEHIAGRIWKPARIKLEINGKEVFQATVTTTLKRGAKLTFPYPT